MTNFMLITKQVTRINSRILTCNFDGITQINYDNNICHYICVK